MPIMALGPSQLPDSCQTLPVTRRHGPCQLVRAAVQSAGLPWSAWRGSGWQLHLEALAGLAARYGNLRKSLQVTHDSPRYHHL